MEIIENIISNNLLIGSKKTQIVLTHTSRNMIDFVSSLKYRFNGKAIKLPHYLVDRGGRIFNFIDDTINGNFTSNQKVNNKSIVICLENLGWLTKEPLKQHYINWIGNIYKEKVVDRKWRDYFFWQPYTDLQIEKTVKLCKNLSKKHQIEPQFIGHNTKVKGVESFLGIITRSNFDEFATDLSPAFDFEKFNKLLKDEKI